jgi:hypothetical protein
MTGSSIIVSGVIWVSLARGKVIESSEINLTEKGYQKAKEKIEAIQAIFPKSPLPLMLENKQ